MSIISLRYVMTAGLALLASCADGPTQVMDDARRPQIAGEYELVAAGQSVSVAWDNFMIRFEGVLELEQDPTTPSKISGTFREFRLSESVENPLRRDGAITGSIDARGNLILELRASSGYVWSARGLLAGSQIGGQWKSSDPGAGGFTAVRVD